MTDSFFNIPVPDYLSVLMERETPEIESILAGLPEEQRHAITRRLIELVAHKQKQIDGMMEIGAAFSQSLRIEDLLHMIMEKITSLMQAQRSTLFILDHENNNLWSVISQGLEHQKIHLELGHGIAGWVGNTGESLNLCDVQSHEKFDRSFDRKNGFETRTMLCQPIKNAEKEIIGVVQVLNQKEGNFTQEDEYLLAAICGQVAIALENSKLYTDLFNKNETLIEMAGQLEGHVAELDLLVEVERIATQANSLDDAIEALIKKICNVFRASGVFLTLSETPSSCVYQYVPSLNSVSKKTAFSDHQCVGSSVIETQLPFVCATEDVPSYLSESLPFEISSVVGVPLIDEVENRCIGAIQAVHDKNTDRKFTEEELKILSIIASRVVAILNAQIQRDALEKNKRMASMGTMLSGVIHDIKNPISIISGYVQLMERNGQKEKRKEFAGAIKKQFHVLDRMTRELLEYAKGQTTMLRRKLYLGDFFDDFKELLSMELNARGIELELIVNYRGILFADESKVQRVILNLARNAAYAMPRGGIFSIQVDEDGDWVVFNFTDNGEGIPLDVREHIFDAFVSSGKKDGTGLGLAIVKKMAEEHKGTISFKSVLNQGTTFTLRIPKGLE